MKYLKISIVCSLCLMFINVNADETKALKFQDIKQYLAKIKTKVVEDYKVKGKMRPILFRSYYNYTTKLIANKRLEKDTRISRDWYVKLQSSFISLYKAKENINNQIYKKNKRAVEAGYVKYKDSIMNFQKILQKPIKAKRK